MRVSRLVIIVLLLVVGSAMATPPNELLVAAAADLNPALKEVAEQFQKNTGVEVKLTFGASGNLFAQIENGAPFDLFFSADRGYPDRLVKDGFGDAASL